MSIDMTKYFFLNFFITFEGLANNIYLWLCPRKIFSCLYIHDSFVKITWIKKIDICIKVVCNYCWFYNFIF